MRCSGAAEASIPAFDVLFRFLDAPPPHTIAIAEIHHGCLAGRAHAMKTDAVTIRRLERVDAACIRGLADVLIDCVEGGASVSFMLPLTRERAEAFWRDVARGVDSGARAILVAEDGAGICGTVQLVLAQPENQPHRADVAKMLVHRRARRSGVGAALLQAIEAVARDCGKTLLVLDTVTGGDAERLYRRLGWVSVGSVPNFALYPAGGFCATTFFYRDLAPAPDVS